MPRLSSLTNTGLTGARLSFGPIITAYTLTPAANNVNEGSSLTFTVSGSNIINGTYYWTVTNSGDFGTASGSFIITNNSGSFSVTPTADTTTEGSETFTVSIRSGSISGTVLQTSISITINDTSLTAVLPTLANRAAAWIDNQNSSTIYYSDTAGNNWTAVDIGILDQWQTGARSGNNLMLVSANRRVITSTNGGQTWTQQAALLPTPASQTFSFRYMATDGSTWVVIPRSESSQPGTQFFYSTNFGTSWTVGNFGASPDNFNFWEYVTYDSGRWIAFSSISNSDSGQEGPRYAVSSDGISWGATISTNKPRNYLYPGFHSEITYSSTANKWYFGRETGTVGEFRLFIGSSTGNSWTIKTTSPAGSTNFNPTAIAVNDAGRLVLVNQNILNTWYSDDEGTTWNVVPGVWPTTGAFANSTGTLNRFRVLDNQFACVMNGVIYYSVDGIGWSTPSSPPSGLVNHIL